MKIKRLLVILLTVIMAISSVSLLSACSGEEYVELPHYDTLDGSYDTSLMYSNLLKTNQGDPGGLWVSKDDDPVWGGYCYVAVTTLNNKISSADYPDYSMVAFEIHRSKDLANWECVGALDGSGLGIERGSWIETWTWAPELWRDDLTDRYFLYFSARASRTFINSGDNDRHCLAIAMSETPVGPFELVTSEEYYTLVARQYGEPEIRDGKLYGGDRYITDVDDNGNILNLNGDSITKTTPTVNFNSDSARKHIIESVSEIGIFSAIDASFFRASNGDTYMYFDNHLNSFKESISSRANADPNYDGVYNEDYSWQYNNNDIWVMKMKDLITPDYSTLNIVSTPRYKSVRAYEETVDGVRKVSIDPRKFIRTDEFYEIGEGNNVNEGAHVIENDGKFFLTYSPTGTGNVLYSINQAVSDSPLGPFTKLTDYNPVIGMNDTTDYISCTGHHSFVYIEDEIFALYHCFWQEMSSSGGRCIAADRVNFLYNEELGYEILYGNGPTLAVQPINTGNSDMSNIAKTATITVNDKGNTNTVKYLTDGYFPSQSFGESREFTSNGPATITLKWYKPQKVEAIFVYNSCNYYNAFTQVDDIKFELAYLPDWTDEIFSKAIIRNLKCNPVNANANELSMRNGGGAVASFKPLYVNQITLTVSSKYTYEHDDGSRGRNERINISEIYITGKEA